MNELEFFEDTHTYWLNGKKLTGTTSLIKEFVPAFDAQYWSKYIAKKRNLQNDDVFFAGLGSDITPEDILKEWDAIREIASERGKFIHKYLEDVLQGIWRDCDERDSLKGVNQYLNESYYGKVIGCEMLLNNEDFAGTADLLVEHNGQYIIRDWKTNRQFRTECPYGTKMLSPLSSWYATEFYVYTLQLNMYRYLMKPLYDVTKLEIVWFDHEGNYQVIELPIAEKQLFKMIKAYAARKTHSGY